MLACVPVPVCEGSKAFVAILVLVEVELAAAVRTDPELILGLAPRGDSELVNVLAARGYE